jgi:hypothetical protein
VPGADIRAILPADGVRTRIRDSMGMSVPGNVDWSCVALKGTDQLSSRPSKFRPGTDLGWDIDLGLRRDNAGAHAALEGVDRHVLFGHCAKSQK